MRSSTSRSPLDTLLRLRLLAHVITAAAAIWGVLLAPPAVAAARRERAAPDSVPTISFEENGGQLDARVRYLARVAGRSLLFTEDEIVIQAEVDRPGGPEPAIVWMRFEGSSDGVEIEGLDQRAAVSNYYRGQDPSRWVTGVRHYARLRSRNVYPGVDAIYYQRNGRLELDIVVAPGADPAKARMRFEGSEGLAVDADGRLVLRGASHFAVAKGGAVRFELDTGADPPELVYSTYLGGSDVEPALGFGKVAATGTGEVCVTGGRAPPTSPC